MTRGPAKQFDRQEVLEKAMQLFWAQGYEATGTAQLLKHMGIGRQSLYDTFGDKKSLFLEAVSRYFELFLAPLVDVLRSPGSPIANVRRFLEAVAQMGPASDYRGCLVANSVAELARRDTEVAEALTRCYKTLERALRETLDAAREAGELDSPLGSEQLARMLIATGQGLSLVTKLEGNRDWTRGTIDGALAILGGP